MTTATLEPTTRKLSADNRREILASTTDQRQQRMQLGSESGSEKKARRQPLRGRKIVHTTKRKPVRRNVPRPTPVRQPEPVVEERDDGFRFTVDHAFIVFGYVVGLALFGIFGLDLIVKIPFQRASILYDVTNVIGGLTLAYLSWNCQRDL